MSISKTLVVPGRVKCHEKRVEDMSRTQVAFEVYSRLPREIRNRVYTYCIQGSCDNEVIVRRALGQRNACAFLTRRRSLNEHSYQWVEDPIASVINAEQLGIDVAREMLESYYWTRIFKFSQHESSLLEAFLTTDKFGLNMYPADYARHVHLQLQPPKYLAPSSRKGPSDFRRCLAALENLRHMHTTRLQFVFDMDLVECAEECSSYHDDPAPLLAVQVVAKSLNAKGLRTKIACRTSWDD